MSKEIIQELENALIDQAKQKVSILNWINGLLSDVDKSMSVQKEKGEK